MSSSFQAEFQKRADEVNKALAANLQARPAQAPALSRLLESVSYSVRGPGKRTRPVLALWVCEALGGKSAEVMPWAQAIEFIHTYSLIHDDLPCMDNDDERRGRPTNHKAFDEATALLAGDALLTEAFRDLARAYKKEPAVGMDLISLLGEAAGMEGMIGGQVLDMAAEKSAADSQTLELLHRWKTGALIAAAAEGAAICAKAPSEKRKWARQFGENLGLAFQIADDLLDRDEGDQGGRSYVDHYGVEGAFERLQQAGDHALSDLKNLNTESPWLAQLVEWNRTRTR